MKNSLMKSGFVLSLLLSIFSLVSLSCSSPGPVIPEASHSPILSSDSLFHPEVAKDAMVASQNRLASLAGLKVLQEGGNAVDAAVTMGFTMAVTLPRAGNIGGGGFMLIHLADKNDVVAIDYREKAPKKAYKEMFLDGNGDLDSKKSRYSHLAVGVPGTVAGMILALEKYGTISLKRALQPAISYAQNGFIVDHDLANSLKKSYEKMKESKEALEIFYKSDGTFYEPGERFYQKDLARSLKSIAAKGNKAFYEGWIAEKIVQDMTKNGGLVTNADLKEYRAQLKTSAKGHYRGYDIYGMPPPSSGGVHIIQMLNTLENYPKGFFGHNTAKSIHLLAEVMKRAYADRSKYLGDPDFVDVPLKELLSTSYSKQIAGSLNLKVASNSSQIKPGNLIPYESNETTHFSVVDKDGNAVSNTYTLNFSYGSKIVVPGTGILLNNEMDDFSGKPGVPNAYGLIGGSFNAVEPEKRMLSSMSPTIVTKDGKVFLVTGTLGGSRIISTTLQLILNVIDFDMNIAEATNAVRIHHQWFPNELRVEKGLNQDTTNLLKEMGHSVVENRAMGSTQSIMSKDGVLYGASDPRYPGALTIGL